MTPEWGSQPADLPPETQFLLLELEEGGPYAIMLPLIDSSTFRGTLRPPRCPSVWPLTLQSCLLAITLQDMTPRSETVYSQQESADSNTSSRIVVPPQWQLSCRCASGSSPSSSWQ